MIGYISYYEETLLRKIAQGEALKFAHATDTRVRRSLHDLKRRELVQCDDRDKPSEWSLTDAGREFLAAQDARAATPEPVSEPAPVAKVITPSEGEHTGPFVWILSDGDEKRIGVYSSRSAGEAAARQVMGSHIQRNRIETNDAIEWRAAHCGRIALTRVPVFGDPMPLAQQVALAAQELEQAQEQVA